MNTEIPAQAVVAIATVVAALITGVIAMVNLTLGKEQKVTEMRQAWIDGLRNDLATYFAAYRFIANSVEDVWHKENTGVVATHMASQEAVAEQALLGALAIYRIKLRLNAAEKAHFDLERLLDEITKQYESHVDGKPNLRKLTIAAIALANDQARKVLKFEWERVKSGEQAFANLRKWVAPTIVVVMAIFVGVILTANFN